VACRAAGTVGPIEREVKTPTALALMSIVSEPASAWRDVARVADGVGSGRLGASGPDTVAVRALLPDSA